MKKLCAGILALLLGIFSGCSAMQNTPPATTDPPSTLIPAPSTEVAPTRRPYLTTDKLKQLFENQRQSFDACVAIFESAAIPRAEILSVDTMRYIIDEDGTFLPFDEEETKVFTVFLNNARTEIGGGMIEIVLYQRNNKRVITFSFYDDDESTEIVYMPDGYVEREYADPALYEVDFHEAKLAENWYSYYR